MDGNQEGIGDKPPRFVIPVCPREVPADLLALPSEASVHYVEPRLCGRTGEGIGKAGHLADIIRRTIARQSAGWLTIEEAAQLLEDAGRGNATGRGGWLEKLGRAARVGELPMHEPGSLGRIHYGLKLVEDEGAATLATVGGRKVILARDISHMDERRLRPFYEWAHVDDLNRWIEANEPRLPFRFEGVAHPTTSSTQANVTERRQERRYQMCLDANLKMPPNDYARLPRGIGALAKKEGITRQAFSEDVKAHIRRLNGR